MLFWREPNDRNRVRSQDLLPVLSTSEAGVDYRTLLAGVTYGAVRSDFLGRLHVLLVERPEINPLLSVTVLYQPQPGGEFAALWRSREDPLWSIEAAGSQLQVQESAESLLPDIQIIAPLAATGDLRKRLDAPDAFVERPPFARQWAATLWRFVSIEEALELSGVVRPGYNLEDEVLVSTPLTALAHVLAALQTTDVGAASNYVSRIDLLQQVYDMGLYQPGLWIGIYLDENGREVFGHDVTRQVRLFDNGDRERSYVAVFDQGLSGEYRLSALLDSPAYWEDNLITASPLPTSTAAYADHHADAPRYANCDRHGRRGDNTGGRYDHVHGDRHADEHRYAYAHGYRYAHADGHACTDADRYARADGYADSYLPRRRRMRFYADRDFHADRDADGHAYTHAHRPALPGAAHSRRRPP